jgi:very-short-patch-repair endonuclease
MPKQETLRLEKLYEGLRERLLDMSLRNPLLSYKHRPSSKKQLQIVDEVPQAIYELLTGGASLEVLALPEPADAPQDEQTEDFVAALAHAKASDLEHLTKIEALESQGRDDEIELGKAERDLRDKVRTQLGLPPRPTRKTINPSEHAKSLDIDPSIELKPAALKDSHSDKKLQTLKWPDNLESILERIADDARLAEQETGLSTLFLVFGFLEWCEKEDSKKLFAPLLMLPVKLEKRKGARGKLIFTLSALAEVADSNLSLQTKVQREFARQIPDVDTGEDEAGSVEAYFARVSEAIEGLKGWHVRRWLTLGHFAFGRFAMYADLAPSNWAAHPVSDDLVGSIVRGTELAGDGGSSLFMPPEDYLIDDPEVEKIAPILIHDADASQHSALVDAMKEKNLVIQGPPGTGKSQTITNIIANALAADKSVLFLAEKQAALDVVKRRLVTAGLGDFCLELHSDKATPRLVIESLKQRMTLGFGRRGAGSLAMDPTWADNRREIGSYVNALHAAAEDGRTPFDLMWHALRSRSQVGTAIQFMRSVSLPDAVLAGGLDCETAQGAMSLYADMATRFSATYALPQFSPWSKITFSDTRRPNTIMLIDDLADLKEAAEKIVEIAAPVAELGFKDLSELDHLIQLNSQLETETPSGPSIVALCELKAEDIASLVTIQENRWRLDAEMKGREWARDIPEEDFATILALAVAVEGTEQANMRPGELYAWAVEHGAAADAICRAFDQISPAVELLGSMEELPSSSPIAIMLAAKTASMLDDETRNWFSWLASTSPDALKAARTEWADVMAEEARWRGRFPGCAGAWPTRDELRAAAEIASKGSFGRLFGTLTGDSKILASIVQRLGVTVGVRIPAEDLIGLGQHVQAMAAFLNNRSHQQLFGSHWSGLKTPIERIAGVEEARKTALAKVEEAPGGEAIVARVQGFSAAGLFALGQQFENTRGAVALIGEHKDLLDEQSYAAKLASLSRSRCSAKAITGPDPEQRLVRFDGAIRDLKDGVEFQVQRRTAEQKLLSHPLTDRVQDLAGDPSIVDRTSRGLDWIESTKQQAMPAAAADALLSAEAPAVRARMQEVATQALPALQNLREKLKRLEAVHGVSGLLIAEPGPLIDQLQDLLPRRDELSEFLALRDQREDLSSRGLGPLLANAEELGVTPSQLPGLFSGLVAQRRADHEKQSNAVLSRASGLRIETRRKDFIERDKRKIEADRRRVKEILLVRRPSSGNRYGSRKTWTDMELLNNEFGKERRFVPVRDLMQRAGGAVQALAPCFMMSPLSLAKFLPAGQLQFDLLVIDEASQMRPEDALGGLLRAKQLIVVGDQKQLPPTDFFARSGDPLPIADEEGDFEDLDDESILEACQKTFRETRLLRWHYRSRCESLISFSNREFYKSELISFPMAKPGSFSVDLIRVNGHYEARRNPAEAQAIAEEAILFMRRYADESAEKIPTLGIVAVNSDQRDLIFEEIRRLESDDSFVERYREKVTERGEPVFVKNLENVQGDERDFILISMTYGPRPGSAVVAQRFGPINGKQGHRRLNVLFSRARMRIGLFASFGSADVKPQEASAEGVHVLKRYLEFAETRGQTAGSSLGPCPDSDFEVEVADRLRARGFKVDYQIGVSGFKIDLGIRHPDHPERYLAGVECDGAAYHSSKSARDRDRLREEVLVGLGWRLLRVWSTDWFDNADLQTERLIARLEELRTAPVELDDGYKFSATQVASFHHSPVEPVDPGEESISKSEPEAQADLSQPDASGGPVRENLSWERKPLLASTGPLNSEDLHTALREFRETVIAEEMKDWEPHRSILREGMIEAIVGTKLDDPEDWFRKIPSFQRQSTNPAERKHYLESICEIVARLDETPIAAKRPGPDFSLTSPAVTERPKQGLLFGGGGPTVVPRTPEPVPNTNAKSTIYLVANVAESGVKPVPIRFFDQGYLPELTRMIAHVVSTEGPIYSDQLVTRIARAHNYQRNGGAIVEKVMRATDRRFPRTTDDNRELIWPAGSTPAAIHPFRSGAADQRDHGDIPLVELASLTLPHLSAGRITEEEILERLRDHFGLARLREATRNRFVAAIGVARAALEASNQ